MLSKWVSRERTAKPLSRRAAGRVLRVEWLEPRLALSHAPLGDFRGAAERDTPNPLPRLSTRRRRMFRATMFGRMTMMVLPDRPGDFGRETISCRRRHQSLVKAMSRRRSKAKLPSLAKPMYRRHSKTTARLRSSTHRRHPFKADMTRRSRCRAVR